MRRLWGRCRWGICASRSVKGAQYDLKSESGLIDKDVHRFGFGQLIGKYIEDIEALGNIGSKSMDKVCKIISRSRRL